MKRAIIRAICFAVSPVLGLAQSPGPGSAEINAAVHGFHEALTKGDRSAAMELLAPDAAILESGAQQTREEYACRHLAEDIAFAKAVQSTISDFAVHQDGNVAWTTATSHTFGTFDGKPVNSAGAELVILTNSAAGWRIRAIHWSNRKILSDK